MAYGDDNEKLYDERVGPLVQAIYDLCRRHGIPCVLHFEYAPGAYARTMWFDAENGSSSTWELGELANRQITGENFISQGDTRPGPSAN